MRNLLVIFGGEDYDHITAQNLDHHPGITEMFVYDDVFLMQQPASILNAHMYKVEPPRCIGYCWWKPFIIMHTLDRCQPGDVVFYVDADCRIVNDLSPVFEYTREHGAMFFASCGHRQATWCKTECYEVMNMPIVDAQAGCARFCAFSKSDAWRPRQFLMEWLTYSVNTRANTKHTTTSRAGFAEHRDEQAIMSLLCHKYGYPLHRECDQTGEDPTFYAQDRDLYPQLFEQIHCTHGRNGKGSKYRRVP